MPVSITMENIVGQSRRVSGHVDLVPCRLCTAYVPREQLAGGLLPEETHHDADDLRDFHMQERKRRDDHRKRIMKEISELRKAEYSPTNYVYSGGAVRKVQARKKPAAATTRKKPAAATTRKKPAAARTRKKPARA